MHGSLRFHYGHDGPLYNLDSDRPAHQLGVLNGPTTDPALLKNKGPLSNFEIGQLKAFMFALTDSALLKDPRFFCLVKVER